MLSKIGRMKRSESDSCSNIPEQGRSNEFLLHNSTRKRTGRPFQSPHVQCGASAWGDAKLSVERVNVCTIFCRIDNSMQSSHSFRTEVQEYGNQCSLCVNWRGDEWPPHLLTYFCEKSFVKISFFRSQLPHRLEIMAPIHGTESVRESISTCSC